MQPATLRESLNPRQSISRIPKPRHTRHPKPIRHAQVQVVHRQAVKLDVAAGRERAAAAAGEDDRQVDVRVAVAVGVPSAVDDHRVVEQRVAVDVLGRVELLEERANCCM